MSWPTKTWTVNGWKNFKKPELGKPDELFPDDWEAHKSSVDNSTYWDVIDNPLYEAAANASGIDWDRFVTESGAAIGDYKDSIVKVQTDKGGKHIRTGRNTYGKSEPTYEDMTVAQAMEAGYTQADFVIGIDPGYRSKTGRNRYTVTEAFYILGGKKDQRDWGIDRGKFGSIAEDLDTMHEWLTKTIKTHSLQDMPIIDRGPQGSDYGIEGDIWAHYGLDKPPKPPKAMDVNYEFNLLTAKPSSATYATPEGFPVLDKSTESVPYGSTHYARWTAQKEQESQAAQTEYDTTSYGEPA